MLVTVLLHAMMRGQENFPDSDVFCPDRWLKEEIKESL